MNNKFNSNSKKIIRSNWAKPILSYLRNTLGKKLIYLGLPDTEAHDVYEWLEFIDIVYAFQCRDYPEPHHPDQSRDRVLALEDTLRGLERKRKISTYDVFDGYIEEVIIRGYDNSPTIKEFIQEDTITIYNLDFCGQVTSPIEYIDRNGDKQKAFKFNAIDRLLNYQKDIPFPNKKFVVFLTLHCSYDGKELENFMSHPPNSDIETYLKQANKMRKPQKSPFCVKAFVYHNLIQFFTQNYFNPEFLPTIYYKGDNEHPLLFFTIIGTQVDNASGVPAPFQKIKNLVNRKFISVTVDGDFKHDENLVLPNDTNWDRNLRPLHLFKKSKTYKKLWL